MYAERETKKKTTEMLVDQMIADWVQLAGLTTHSKNRET
jgi:hypothetical protein